MLLQMVNFLMPVQRHGYEYAYTWFWSRVLMFFADRVAFSGIGWPNLTQMESPRPLGLAKTLNANGHRVCND
jgi:hypothetical protein